MTGEKERVTAGLHEFGRRSAAPPGGVLATPRSGATLRPLLAAVETMQLGVVIADESGVILYANPAQARMYGVD
ncbi:MAG: PAS domain-containing protein, partial [Gemmatimonadota bacterium]|nr:PAS domain-containing protein [Gemmatimonadota bacterium]